MKRALGLTILIAAVAAAPAHAGTVGVHDGVLTYAAATGEYNELVIMLQGGEFTIQDGRSGTRDTLPVTAEPPCRHDESPPENGGLIDAYCPPSGVTSMRLDVGDGADYVDVGGIVATDFPATVTLGDDADRADGGPQGDTIDGGPGNDTIDGRDGRDMLIGGEGDDVLQSGTDGIADTVSCGPGSDVVHADASDFVQDDCEQVDRNPQSVSSPPAQPVVRPHSGVDPGPPVNVTPYRSVRQLLRRGLHGRVACADTCNVELSVQLLTNKHGGPPVMPGTALRTEIGSGLTRRHGHGTLRFVARISRAGARRIRRLHRAPDVRLVVVVTEKGGPAGDTTEFFYGPRRDIFVGE